MNKLTLNKPVFLVFGAAGVGKTSILKRIEKDPELQILRVVTCTTRLPRINEKNGIDYQFLTKEQFLAKTISQDPQNGLLEWSEFNGNYYGTPVAPFYTHWATSFALTVDIQGVIKLHQAFDSNVFLIRIFVTDYHCLQKRMASRKPSEQDILSREKEDHAQVDMIKKLQMPIDLEIENLQVEQSVDKLRNFILSKTKQNKDK